MISSDGDRTTAVAGALGLVMLELASKPNEGYRRACGLVAQTLLEAPCTTDGLQVLHYRVQDFVRLSMEPTPPQTSHQSIPSFLRLWLLKGYMGHIDTVLQAW